MSILIFTSGSTFVGGALAPFIWNRTTAPVAHYELQGAIMISDEVREVRILLPVTEPFESTSSIVMALMSEMVICSEVRVTWTCPPAGIGL